jgi:hypothetical protein
MEGDAMSQPRRITPLQYGCRYTVDHSLLSPSGRMGKRARTAVMKREEERCDQAISRTEEYYAAIREGSIEDPDRPHLRRQMLEAQRDELMGRIRRLRAEPDIVAGFFVPRKDGKPRAAVSKLREINEKRIAELSEELGQLNAVLRTIP